MKTWTNAIVDRLDAAYRVRFDKDESLIFLNDAYQNLLILELKAQLDDNEQLNEFIKNSINAKIISDLINISPNIVKIIITQNNNLFIGELVDRYPSNYHNIEAKIAVLHQMNDQVLSISK